MVKKVEISEPMGPRGGPPLKKSPNERLKEKVAALGRSVFAEIKLTTSLIIRKLRGLFVRKEKPQTAKTPADASALTSTQEAPSVQAQGKGPVIGEHRKRHQPAPENTPPPLEPLKTGDPNQDRMEESSAQERDDISISSGKEEVSFDEESVGEEEGVLPYLQKSLGSSSASGKEEAQESEDRLTSVDETASAGSEESVASADSVKTTSSMSSKTFDIEHLRRAVEEFITTEETFAKNLGLQLTFWDGYKNAVETEMCESARAKSALDLLQKTKIASEMLIEDLKKARTLFEGQDEQEKNYLPFYEAIKGDRLDQYLEGILGLTLLLEEDHLLNKEGKGVWKRSEQFLKQSQADLMSAVSKVQEQLSPTIAFKDFAQANLHFILAVQRGPRIQMLFKEIIAFRGVEATEEEQKKAREDRLNEIKGRVKEKVNDPVKSKEGLFSALGYLNLLEQELDKSKKKDFINKLSLLLSQNRITDDTSYRLVYTLLHHPMKKRIIEKLTKLKNSKRHKEKNDLAAVNSPAQILKYNLDLLMDNDRLLKEANKFVQGD